MAIQIGINGFGRIGRVAFRIAIDKPEEFHLCGINVRNANLEYMVYMIRYDSIFGRFQGTLDTYENGIVVNGQKIPVYSESDASLIPWGECGAEYILYTLAQPFHQFHDAARSNRSREQSHLNQGQQEHIRPARPNHRINAAAKNEKHNRRKYPQG